MLIGSKPAMKKIQHTNIDPIIINNTIVERVQHAKNLGLTFDEVLSWRKHINLSIGKAMCIFLQFSRYKRFLNAESKQLLCESLVLTQFNYCDIVYNSIDINLQKKIQRIQDICLRFIFNYMKGEKCNYDLLRQKLGWLNMQKRRLLHSLVQMFKILNSLAPDYLRDTVTLVSELHQVNTRQQNNDIWIDKEVKSKIHRRSFRFYISRLYNNIPENIKSCKSVKSFKHNIYKLLLNNDLVLPTP